MKKLLLLAISGLLAGMSQAQVKVILLRDTATYQLNLSALNKKYPLLSALFRANPKGFQSAVQERWKQQNAFLKTQKNLPSPCINLYVHEYYQPDGNAQIVLVDTDKTYPDSVLAKPLAVLTAFYESTPHPASGNAPFRTVSALFYGKLQPPGRTARRGAGIISTLEAAEKTTRPDTVKMLAFNQLELQTVPEIVYRFPNLEELDLSRNHLRELPARLTADIPTLRRLSLLYNLIPNDSVFVTRNRHLVALNLQGNKLTKIPRSIRQNRRLESLWLGNNSLNELTMRTLRQLRRLTDLNLYNAGLTKLPKTIGQLKRVTVLDLYYNKLTELPRQLGRMKRLEQLAVAHNDLKQLPPSLAKLRRLQVLYAHHNRISQLPAEFQNLTKLRVLDLGYNWFTVAPPVLGMLPSLEELDLNNNNLQEFPTVLASIKNLKKVYMGSNPLFGREALKSPYAPQIKQLEANNTQVLY